MAVKDIRNVGLLDLGAGQVDPDAALVALDHRPPGKRLPAVAGDQVPRIVSCAVKEKRIYVRSPDNHHLMFCKAERARRTGLHHDVFISDPGLPLTGAHLRFPDGLLLRHLPQAGPAGGRGPVHCQLLSDWLHLCVPVPALGVCLTLSGTFEFLGFGLFGVFAAFDASPFLAFAAAAVRRRHGGTQRQLFQLFVLLALGLCASRALV